MEAIKTSIDPEERLEIAVEAAGLGIWDLDLIRDRATYRSLRHDQLFGYTDLQPNWSRTIAARHVVPEDLPVFDAAFAKAVKGGVLHFKVRVRWPDRSVHWIAADGRTYYDGSGRAVRIAGVVRDATQEQEARREAERAKGLLDAIFDAAPIGLGAWDEDFRFLKVNARLAEINGLPAEAHIGLRPDEILPDIAGLDEVYGRWRQILRTGEPWLDVEIKGATPAAPGAARSWSENFFPIRTGNRITGIGAVVEETTERKRQEQHLQMLLQEVNHRAKNLLAVVQAVVRQLSQTDEERAFAKRIKQRLASLAACQELLVKHRWGGISLEELARSQLAHFNDLLSTRIRISGEAVYVRASAAQIIGMALHELGTNAGKYGALSMSEGQVHLAWDVHALKDGRPALAITWMESGGPQIEPPQTQGFGHSVVTRMVEYGLDADVELRFDERGLRWSCLAPQATIFERDESHGYQSPDR